MYDIVANNQMVCTVHGFLFYGTNFELMFWRWYCIIYEAVFLVFLFVNYVLLMYN